MLFENLINTDTFIELKRLLLICALAKLTTTEHIIFICTTSKHVSNRA